LAETSPALKKGGKTSILPDVRWEVQAQKKKEKKKKPNPEAFGDGKEKRARKGKCNLLTVKRSWALANPRAGYASSVPPRLSGKEGSFVVAVVGPGVSPRRKKGGL